MGKSGKSGKVNRADPTDLTWIQKLPDCAKLEKTVDHLQQENEDLQKRITDMEKKDKRAKKMSRALDGISLLVEAAKKI